LPSLVSIKRRKKLNDYTYRLLISKELAKTRVVSEWFINGETMTRDGFIERMVRYGFTAALGVRAYVFSSYSSLANVHGGANRIAKNMVEYAQ
jgi:hypothetical protein